MCKSLYSAAKVQKLFDTFQLFTIWKLVPFVIEGSLIFCFLRSWLICLHYAQIVYFLFLLKHWTDLGFTAKFISVNFNTDIFCGVQQNVHAVEILVHAGWRKQLGFFCIRLIRCTCFGWSLSKCSFNYPSFRPQVPRCAQITQSYFVLKNWWKPAKKFGTTISMRCFLSRCALMEEACKIKNW